MAKPKSISSGTRTYTIVEPGNGWRERIKNFKADFSNRDLDDINTDIENRVYAMARDGISLPIIADYFGIERKAFKSLYTPVWRAGRAELQAVIAQHTVDYGLNSDIPVAKIWLGKSLGGLSDGSADVDVDESSDVGGAVNLNITLVKAVDVARGSVDTEDQ